jgi:hypothetical protein
MARARGMPVTLAADRFGFDNTSATLSSVHDS